MKRLQLIDDRTGLIYVKQKLVLVE